MPTHTFLSEDIIIPSKVQVRNTVFSANHGIVGAYREYGFGAAILVTGAIRLSVFDKRTITGW